KREDGMLPLDHLESHTQVVQHGHETIVKQAVGMAECRQAVRVPSCRTNCDDTDCDNTSRKIYFAGRKKLSLRRRACSASTTRLISTLSMALRAPALRASSASWRDMYMVSINIAGVGDVSVILWVDCRNSILCISGTVRINSGY